MTGNYTSGEEKAFSEGVLGGFILGAIITAVIGVLAYSSADIFDNARQFQAENGRPVIRLYKKGSDQILVGEDESGANYTTLEKYLESFKAPADKNLEKVKIEKLVGWYDD